MATAPSQGKLAPMVVAVCQHSNRKKFGKTASGAPRFRCKDCGKTWSEADRPLGAMRTSLKDAALILGMLMEGMSIRSASRLTGLKPNTICDLILTVGENCERLLAAKVASVAVSHVEADEVWSFVGCKERTRISRKYTGDEGHSWTFVAIDRDTKLVLAHEVGQRDNATCCRFLNKLNAATVGRFQLSTDGLGAYTLNVPYTFRGWVDFGQLIKHFQNVRSVGRYSPAKIIKAERRPMYGNPVVRDICTSHIERWNLTLRMACRRFTRLTNGHSKSLRHHKAMQALFVCWYNFCRKHETLKGRTPAMAGRLAGHPWTMRELLEAAAQC